MRQRVQRLIESRRVQIVAVTDPLTLGFRRMAMIGLRVEGDLRVAADTIASIPEVDYVVIVGGSFDLLLEVVCEDDDHLLALLNDKIRAIPGVREHRDVHLPPPLQADLRVGNPMSGRTHGPGGARRARAPPPVDALQPPRRRTRPTAPSPIIARGEGCYVWDAHGKRYLDGLSGLFTVQLGHGRPDLAEAARPARPRRSSTSRSGRTRTRRRSSSRRASPSSRPAT